MADKPGWKGGLPGAADPTNGIGEGSRPCAARTRRSVVDVTDEASDGGDDRRDPGQSRAHLARELVVVGDQRRQLDLSSFSSDPTLAIAATVPEAAGSSWKSADVTCQSVSLRSGEYAHQVCDDEEILLTMSDGIDLAASTVRSCSATEIPSAGEQSWTNHQQCADDQRQHVDRPCTVRRGRCGREQQNTGETVARSRERDSRASGRYWAGNRHRPYEEASVIIRLSKEEHRNRRGGYSPNQDGSGEDSSPRHTGNRTNGRWGTLRSGSDPSPACGTARRPRDGRQWDRANPLRIP